MHSAALLLFAPANPYHHRIAITLALLSLWVVPVVVFRLASRQMPTHAWCATGLAFGLLADPASQGLYFLFWFGAALVPFLGWLALAVASIGLVGLPLWELHAEPGWRLALATAAVEPGVVQGWEHLYIAAFCALVWVPVYGAMGFVLDLMLKRRRARA